MISPELLASVYTFRYEGAKSGSIPNYMYINRVLARFEAVPEAAVKEYCFPLYLLLRVVKVGRDRLMGETVPAADSGYQEAKVRPPGILPIQRVLHQ